MNPAPWVLNVAYDRLTAFVNMDVFNDDFLLSFAAVPVERFEECGEGSGELTRLIQIFTPKLKSLAWKHRSSITFHRCIVPCNQLCGNHTFKFVFWFDANQSHYCSFSFGARIAFVGSGDRECVHCLISNYLIPIVTLRPAKPLKFRGVLE
jgi:hypothetical protein